MSIVIVGGNECNASTRRYVRSMDVKPRCLPRNVEMWVRRSAVRIYW